MINALSEQLSVAQAQVKALERHSSALEGTLHEALSRAHESTQYAHTQMAETTHTSQRDREHYEAQLQGLQQAMHQASSERDAAVKQLTEQHASLEHAQRYAADQEQQREHLERGVAELQLQLQHTSQAEQSVSQRCQAAVEELESQRQSFAALSARFSQAVATADASEEALDAAKLQASQIPRMQADIEDLTHSLQQARAAANAEHNKLQALQAEHSRVQQELAQLRQSEAQLRTKYSALGDRMEQTLAAAKEAHRMEVSTAKQELHQAQQQTAAMRSAVDRAETRCDAHESALAAAREREAELRAEMAELRGRADQYASAAAQLAASRETEASLRRDVEAAREAAHSSALQLQRTQSESHTTASQLSERLRQEYQSMMADRVSQLQDSLAAAEKRADSAEVALGHIKSTHVDRAEAAETMNERVAAAKRSLEGEKEDAVREAVSAVRRAAAAEAAAHDDKRVDELAAAAAKIKELQRELAAQQSSSSDYERECRQLRSRAETATADCGEAKTRLAELESLLDGAKAQLAAEVRTRERLAAEQSSATKRAAELQATLDTSTASHEARLREMGAVGGAAARIMALEQRLQTAEEDSASASQRAGAAEAEVATALPQLREQLARAAARISSLESQLQESQEALARSKADRAGTEEQLLELRRAGDDSALATERAGSKLCAAEDDLQAANTELAGTKAALQAANRQLQQLQAASGSMSMRLQADKRAALSSVAARAGALQQSLREVRSAVLAGTADVSNALLAGCSQLQMGVQLTTHQLHTQMGASQEAAVKASKSKAEQATQEHIDEVEQKCAEAIAANQREADAACSKLRGQLSTAQSQLHAATADAQAQAAAAKGATASREDAEEELATATARLRVAQTKVRNLEAEHSASLESAEQGAARVKALFKRLSTIVEVLQDCQVFDSASAHAVLSPDGSGFEAALLQAKHRMTEQGQPQVADGTGEVEASLKRQLVQLQEQLQQARAVSAWRVPPPPAASQAPSASPVRIGSSDEGLKSALDTAHAEITQLTEQLQSSQARLHSLEASRHSGPTSPGQDAARCVVLQARIEELQRSLAEARAALDSAKSDFAAQKRDVAEAAFKQAVQKWRPRAETAEDKARRLADKVQTLRGELLQTARSADEELGKERSRAAAASAEAKVFEDSLGRHRRRLEAREMRVKELKTALRSTRVSLNSLRSGSMQGALNQSGAASLPGRFVDDASSVGSVASGGSAHDSALRNASPRSADITSDSHASAPPRVRGAGATMGVAFRDPSSASRRKAPPGASKSESKVPASGTAPKTQCSQLYGTGGSTSSQSAASRALQSAAALTEATGVLSASARSRQLEGSK